MNKLRLYTANRIPCALSNLTYSGKFTVTDMMDACEDSNDGYDLIARLKNIGLSDRMSVVRETKYYTRIEIIDPFGNKEYLEADF